jgi:glycosyltransferase involved in cell wall biosynthesis
MATAEATRLNVVIVDGDISYPPTSGKRLRTLNLLLPLARRHRLTYLARNSGDPTETRRAAAFFAENDIETVFVQHPLPRKKGPLFYLRLASNLASPLPYSASIHTSEPMRRAAADLAARQRVDVWQIEWPAYLAAVRGLPGARKVLIAHNVDSLIWQRYFETARNPLKRWYVHGQRRKFERFEKRAFAEADRVVAVSADDAALIRDPFRQPCVDVVENGVDAASFGAIVPRREPGRILFLGALDWRPNLDGLDLFLELILPKLSALAPDARLDVVGRAPPEALRRRLARTPRAALHADVPDVRPFLARAAVMAVPLRIGGGSRLKILEALASGLPVVSTRVGAEGLCLRDGQELTLAEPESMADSLAAVLRNPGPALEQAERGRRLVQERYDWNVLADKLEQSWFKCAEAATCAPC